MILETLYDALYEEYNQTREGIHVSDITLCPREACFRRLDPKKLTNRDLNFFTSGKAIHEALQSLARVYPDRFEIEKEIKWGEIRGHIDLFDKQYHIPIEAKSVRAATMDKPKPHYLTQLEAYMAITNADTGIILVQCLTHYKDKPFLEFYHHMDKEQRKEKIKQMENDAIQLKSGIMNLMPNIVRHIADDIDLNWKCDYCPYLTPCQAFRKLEESNDTASKTT